MKILLDTDFLIALSKDDDSNHKKAEKIAENSKKEQIFITSFTIPEATTVLSYKVSQNTAKDFLGEARKRKFIEIPLSVILAELTDQIFIAQNKSRTSWIDCLNVAVVQIHKLDGILSFDKFYQKQGIKNFTRSISKEA